MNGDALELSQMIQSVERNLAAQITLVATNVSNMDGREMVLGERRQKIS